MNRLAAFIRQALKDRTAADLLLCTTKQSVRVPLWTAYRLWELYLWPPESLRCGHPPTSAYHACTSKRGCMVALVHEGHA